MTDERSSARDLFVLTADADMSATMQGLLRRATDLGIRSIDFTVERHLNRDPGCRLRASHWLRPHIQDYSYALVLLDRHGCGSPASREQIQADVEQDLRRNGWLDRSKAIVIDPELEAWVWSSTNSAATVLGWNAHVELRRWLATRGFWPPRTAKPPAPKNAMKSVLEFKRIRNSSTIFEDLASAVELDMCVDPAFSELKETLSTWFPA